MSDHYINANALTVDQIARLRPFVELAEVGGVWTTTDSVRGWRVPAAGSRFLPNFGMYFAGLSAAAATAIPIKKYPELPDAVPVHPLAKSELDQLMLLKPVNPDALANLVYRYLLARDADTRSLSYGDVIAWPDGGVALVTRDSIIGTDKELPPEFTTPPFPPRYFEAYFPNVWPDLSDPVAIVEYLERPSFGLATNAAIMALEVQKTYAHMVAMRYVKDGEVAFTLLFFADALLPYAVVLRHLADPTNTYMLTPITTPQTGVVIVTTSDWSPRKETADAEKSNIQNIKQVMENPTDLWVSGKREALLNLRPGTFQQYGDVEPFDPTLLKKVNNTWYLVVPYQRLNSAQVAVAALSQRSDLHVSLDPPVMEPVQTGLTGGPDAEDLLLPDL